MLGEKQKLSGAQARLESEYARKRAELEHDLGQKTAEYEKKSGELSRQYEKEKKDLDARMADIQQRLVVEPVLALIAEIRRNDLFQMDLGFKPDELVKLIWQDDEDRPARLALVEDSLAGANDLLFKSKLLYVLFGVTRDEKWKERFVELVRSDPTKVPFGISSVLTASAWNRDFSRGAPFYASSTDEMCGIGIMVLKAQPPSSHAEREAGRIRDGSNAGEADVGSRLLLATREVDGYERASMLGACGRLAKPVEDPNELGDPQLLLTGVKIARDQLLREHDDYLIGMLDALYNLSRPAAFCTSMKLLVAPRPPQAADSTVLFRPTFQERVVQIAIEAEEATHNRRKFNQRTIRPTRWLRENRELVRLWMEDDLQR
ncbi:MAG: hypothetical protein WAL52_19175 [Candidatus Sulfotelmatobacter sp.]